MTFDCAMHNVHDLTLEAGYNLRSLQEVGWGWVKGILSCCSCYRNVGVGDCDNSPQDSQLRSKHRNCGNTEVISIPQTKMSRASYETYDNMDLADEKVSLVMVRLRICLTLYLSLGVGLAQFLHLLILSVDDITTLLIS